MSAASGPDPSGSPRAGADDPFGGLGDLGSAALLALAGLVAAMTLAEPLGARPLASRPASVLLLVAVLGAAVLTHRWLRRGRTGRSARRAQVVAGAPALVVLGCAVGARFLPVGTRDEWYLGGDHVRHLVMAAAEQATGVLSYDVESYPRAWHTLTALVWSALGVRPEDSVVAAVDTGALLAWLLSAALALTTAALAATLGMRRELSQRAAGGAGFVAGCATLWPVFQANYQALGLEASLVAACVLAVVVRSQLVEPAGLRALAVAAAGTVVVAHTWQLLLPVVGLAALRSAWGVARGGRRGAVAVAVAVVATGAASAPALVAVVTRVGVQHASDADVVSPVPWVVLGLGVLAGLVLLARSHDTGLRWLLGAMLLPGVTGLALALYVHVTPATYYPSKLLWHTALLGLAPLAVAVVALAGAVDRASFRGSSVLRVLGGGGVAVVLLYAVIGPVAAFVGSWSTTDGATVLRLVSTPGAAEAQVVWSGGPLVTDTVARIVLDAVDGDERGILRPQESLTVAQECDLLAAAPDPVVLSDRPETQVRERYGCVPDLRVLRVAPSP